MNKSNAPKKLDGLFGFNGTQNGHPVYNGNAARVTFDNKTPMSKEDYTSQLVAYNSYPPIKKSLSEVSNVGIQGNCVKLRISLILLLPDNWTEFLDGKYSVFAIRGSSSLHD